METRQELVRRIFIEVLELAEGERAGFLSRLCGGDRELRRDVEALLRAEAASGEFLPDATRSRAADLLRSRMADAFYSAPGLPGQSAAAKPGDWIGRYQLLEEIGEGGCGIVYLAEQREPVRRRVALKVIKLGMDTRQVVARFEAERQTLAMMDHPAIAKVFDGGATETGRPYFAMELARGPKITEYCDAARLGIRNRLELFIEVCQAVQHAHQKGVIHRDLKPSNLLITKDGERAMLKVIDFGIAKAIEGPVSEQTLFSASEQLLGTPAYMSPEQAAGNRDLDTRTDIYSLGVLLYELLTGHTPMNSKELLDSGVDEIRRAIREKAPPRPSVRLQALPPTTLTIIADHRQTDSARLIRLVHRDLDWIVLKCLEKDRSRRYATANGLAADVRRYLENEPLVARPPSHLYRLEKLIQRNKLVFAAGAAVFASLLAALSLTTVMFLRERQLLREAEMRGLDIVALQLMNQGNLKEAESARRKLLATQQEVLGPHHRDVAASLGSLAAILAKAERYGEAERALHESIVIRQRLFGQQDPALAASTVEFGDLLRREGKLELAENAYREALALQTRLGEGDAAMAESLHGLAMVLWAERKVDQAEAALREAMDKNRLSPGDSAGATHIAHDLSRLLREQGKVSELANLYLEIFPRHLKSWPGDVEPELRWLTDGLLAEGKSAQLEALFQRLIPDSLDKEPRAAELLRARAGSRARQDRFPDAAEDFSRAIAMGAGTVHDWFCWATLLAELEQREAYRGVCRRAIEFVRNTSEPAAAEQIAKSCLLLKEPAIDLSAVMRLTDLAARATNNVNIAWFEVTKALAEYREGRFVSALEWLQRSAAHPGESPDREALAETIRALACQALGQPAESEAALEGSFRIFPPQALASGGDLGRDWVSRVFVNVLQREAASMTEMK